MLPLLARPTRLMTITLAAFAALACTAGSAAAADPEPPTCGNKLCLETTHEPATDFVVPDGYIGYRVDVTNPGTSTATKVTLTFSLDSRATLVSSPSGCSQPPAILITCSLGSVKPTGDTPLVFRFLVKAPASPTPAADPLSSTASISADARRNDTGNNPDDPTTEAFSDAPEVVSVELREDEAASVVPQGLELTLNTDPDQSGATGTDRRTAKFKLFAFDFSTTAVIDDEVEDPGFVCPDKLRCPGGGWTESFIPGRNGLTDPFVGKSSMEIELRYDVSTIPNGLTTKNYVLLHDADYNPTTKAYEQVSASCGSNPKPPCLKSVVEQADGDFVVTALVTGNWRWR
jgi:uncharacterized repeat protein (TIGR01451 family)